jgi:hypothetical protein
MRDHSRLRRESRGRFLGKWLFCKIRDDLLGCGLMEARSLSESAAEA